MKIMTSKAGSVCSCTVYPGDLYSSAIMSSLAHAAGTILIQ